MQRGRDLRAQLLALNQCRGERLDVLDRGPIGEIAQRLTERRARRDLRGDQAQLAANFLFLALTFARRRF